MPYKGDHRGIGSHVIELSEEMSDGLDIFDYPAVDTSLSHGKTIEHHLATALNENNNLFEFIVPTEGYDYTYLPMTRLEGDIEILKSNGNAIAAADNVAPVNLLSSALFRQVECELNGVQVADLTSPTYHYKSFIETHLTYGSDAKKTHLCSALYYPDTPGKEEVFTNDCESFKKRKDWIVKYNNKIYFSTPIHIDFFDSKRYLIPGPTIKLKLLKNEDKFCLLSATDAWKIKINSLKLFTRKITIHQDILEKHKEILMKQPAIYPIAQSKIKTYIINNGISATTLSGICMGKLPRSLIIGFVKSDAFNGSFNTNPWLFQHFGVSYVGLSVNGIPVPSRIFQPDFGSGNCVREYRHFLDNIGIGHENESNNIDLDTYVNNSAFFAYDFSPDLCNNYHQHFDKSGYVNLDLQFKQALAQNITVIVFATYNETIKIDGAGQVTLEQ